MILKQLAEARYSGSETVDEFYALYDLETRRFVKRNDKHYTNIFQRNNSIRTTTLFDTVEAAQHELKALNDKAAKVVDFYTNDKDYADHRIAANARKKIEELRPVRVIKITSSMTVL